MAEGRGRAEWARASAVCWLIAEANRNSKARSQPYHPDEFNPYADRKPVLRGEPIDRRNITLLRALAPKNRRDGRLKARRKREGRGDGG